MKRKRHVYLKMKELDEARRLFLDGLDPAGFLAQEEVGVEEAGGRVTALPVWAAASSPTHHLAAMDGIAVVAEKTFGARPDRPVHLSVGIDCQPINTGQVLPQDFDAVIMIENVFEEAFDEEGRERVFIEQPAFPWQHIRKVGEDIIATELILPAGTLIGAFELGALVAGGVYEVAVKKKPRVALIPTGSELVSLDEARQRPPDWGQVVEFNTLVLAGLVTQAGGEAVRFPPLPDDFDRLKAALGQAVEAGFDLVIINAGSSAGTADYTAQALAEMGTVLVHGVNIMPGKPTVLGYVGQTPIMGNPGYPVSAVISFEQFGAPLLARMLGAPCWERSKIEVKPVAALPSKLGLEEFIRVKLGLVGGEMVAVPLHRGAGSVTSLTRADGIIRVAPLAEGVEAGRAVEAELLRPLEEIKGTIVAIGSHDNTLDVLADLLRRSNARFSLSSGNVGSLGGLKALAQGQAHLAGSHLLDPATGQYNVSYIARYLSQVRLKVVRLVTRAQGFMVQPGNPKKIKDLKDLLREDVALINRQAGSGTRVLLDYHLGQAGLAAGSIRGYEEEEYTHMSVAAAVLSGRADVGLGILAAARALHLDFIPLTSESYELIIPEEHFASQKIQALLEVIRSEAFHHTVESLGGYGLEGSGQIVYEQ
ncbi:MAG: molybdopterin biosynthesis protein [Deltaproteobacteria bacterium]|nr:molybdopterin biosynthesis protein [Deltaproteobacteria bacterium]